MKRAMPVQDLPRFFAPRWTWRTALSAGVVTLAIYLLLPFLERLSAPPERTLSVQPVDTVEIPPPRPPPPERERRARETKPPKPKLRTEPRRLSLRQSSMSLSMALGDVGGDFTLDFGLTGKELGEQLGDLVFDPGDLDEPPRPLARLKPLYPPRARMGRIEGEVIVEFVVFPDGTPGAIQVLSSRPGDLFTSAAVRAIERWRFVPGVKDGQAVATRVRQRVEFRLE
jgi:periplasmic protein TonB